MSRGRTPERRRERFPFVRVNRRPIHAGPPASLVPGRRSGTIALAVCLFLSGPLFAQADWYVKTGGDDTNSGQSWGEAFATIQKAVTSAVQLGGYEIWVAEGTYQPTATITIPWTGSKIPLKLYGGFEAGDLLLEDRDWVANPTVIDGQGVLETVIQVSSWVDLVDGFTITGGRAGSLGTGGAIDIRDCGSASPQPVFRNLVIRGNGGDTSHPPSYYEGGGIYVADCSPWIVNSSFSNNRVWAHGGALFARDSEDTPIDTYPIIVNSTFTANHSDVNGGAVGVYRGTLTVINSILWADTAGDGTTHELFGGTLSVSHSDIDPAQPGYAGISGNIQTDPMISGVPNVGRYRLRDGSPCIDAGDDSSVPSFLVNDFDGDDRFVDGTTGTVPGTVDMGADEYVPGSSPGIYYVDGTGGNDLDPGTSWGDALKTLQQAVAVAGSNAEIWVKQGTYTLTGPIVLTDANPNLAFYGGFAGTETTRSQRSTDPSLTVIDGQHTHACFSLAGPYGSPVTGTVIDGFTLTRGNRAVTIEYGDDTVIRNCRILDATTDGAIYNSFDGQLEVWNSYFSGNRSTDEAGAIHMASAADRLTVTDSIFVDNAAEGTTFSTSGCGGAIRAGTGTIERSRFLGNRADRHGGAVYDWGSGEGLSIRNSEFSGNEAGLVYSLGTGGGTWGPVKIMNGSFYGNSGAVGQGAVADHVGDPTITNSILWDNTPTNTFHCAQGRVLYSDVGDTNYSDVDACQTPYGNISADPAFANPAGIDSTVGTVDDDLSLSSGSPALDAGDSTAQEIAARDLAGQYRHIDDPLVTDSGNGPPPMIDMGALERQVSGQPASQYELTMGAEGCATTVPAPGTHTYDYGEVVTVTAVVPTGCQFTGWTGWVAEPSAATTSVTMSWDRTVTAQSKAIRTLTVRADDAALGGVTSVPGGIDCGDGQIACTENFDLGIDVTLGAAPGTGAVFDGWVYEGCSGTGDCQVTMDDDRSVLALFGPEGVCGLGDSMTLDDVTLDWSHTFEACTSITVENFVVKAPASVIFRASDRIVLGDGFAVESGASFTAVISSEVGVRSLLVSKTADPGTASEGQTVTYTIAVQNTGTLSLTEISVLDDKCTAAPVYQSGDDGDGLLAPTETWTYDCSGPAEASDFVNTATATFADGDGFQVSGSGSAEVTVPPTAGCAAGDRWEDLGDGTIRDCNTGLLWLKDATCDALAGDSGADWSTVSTAVAGLSNGTCGLSDGSTAGQWRIPAMTELCGSWAGWSYGDCDADLGLVDQAYFNPAISNAAGTGQWSEGDPFTSVQAGLYWSNDEYTDTTQMWMISATNGQPSHQSKTTYTGWVWPVRDSE